MQISLILMEEIAKLFLIMFMGYALVKTKLLRVQDSKVVSVILVYLVIPCMIVHAFQIDDSPQVRTGLLFAFAAAAAVHVLFLLFTAILRKPCRLSTIEQLTVIYTNAGIFGGAADSSTARTAICCLFLRLSRCAIGFDLDALPQ